MTKVRMLGQISGTRDGADWPSPGETADVPADEAASLIALGMAEPAKGGSETTDAKPAGEKRRKR